MMPRAKTPIRLIAPPVNMFSTPPRPAAAWSKKARQLGGVDARHRDVGAEAVDDQQADREQDAGAQFLGLAEGAPAHVRGHLFRGGCHARIPLIAGDAAPSPGRRRRIRRQDLSGASAGHNPARDAPPRPGGINPRPARPPRGPPRSALPPAFSTASTAPFDAPVTVIVTAEVTSPLPRTRTPSSLRRTTPGRDQRVLGDLAGLQLARIDELLDLAEVHDREGLPVRLVEAALWAAAGRAASARPRSP